MVGIHLPHGDIHFGQELSNPVQSWHCPIQSGKGCFGIDIFSSQDLPLCRQDWRFSTHRRSLALYVFFQV